MQTSSTISVRTSVGRSKSPGIVEFENSGGMGPLVGVEAADTNQVGNTLIAATRGSIPLHASSLIWKQRHRHNIAMWAIFWWPLVTAFFLPPPRWPICLLHCCCTTKAADTALVVLPQIGPVQIHLAAPYPLHLAAVAPKNLACRLAARLASASTWRDSRCSPMAASNVT